MHRLLILLSLAACAERDPALVGTWQDGSYEYIFEADGTYHYGAWPNFYTSTWETEDGRLRTDSRDQAYYIDGDVLLIEPLAPVESGGGLANTWVTTTYDGSYIDEVRLALGDDGTATLTETVSGEPSVSTGFWALDGDRVVTDFGWISGRLVGGYLATREHPRAED